MITYDPDRKLLNIHRTTKEQLDGVIPDASKIDHTLDIRAVHVSGLANNIEAIGAIKSVSDLYLWGNGLETMPESFYLLPLRSLNVTNNLVNGIDFGTWSSTLERLTLRGLRCLSALDSIDSCTNLKVLCLADIRKAQSYPTLQGMSQLKSVTLECFPDWPTITGLIDCPNLEKVWLRKVTVADKSLSGLRNRKEIKLTEQS